MALVLGIDPGSQTTGYGLIQVTAKGLVPVELGTFVGKGTFAQRLHSIGQGLEGILKKYTPDAVAIEKIFLGKNVDSAFKLGHARGVVFYNAACFNIPIHEYTAREVKKGITGSGNAEKEIVRKLICSFLKIKTAAAMDATDAMALAYYHCQQMDVKDRLKQMDVGT